MGLGRRRKVSQTGVGVGEGLVDVGSPGLQQVGEAEGQVAHRNDQVATLRRLYFPASPKLMQSTVLPRLGLVRTSA